MKVELNRIILMGDIHGDLSRLANFKLPEATKKDLLIILGDFSCIWDKLTADRNLTIISQLPFTVAFVDGNHENFKLIKEKEEIIEWNGGQIGRLPGGTIHLLRGEIYNLNNKRVGVCGGANSIDLWHRVEGISWWADEEIASTDIGNFMKNLGDNNHIDIMLSHDCPAALTPQIAVFSRVNGVNISNSQRKLQIINEMVNIDKWYFGHWHMDIPLNDKFTCLYKSCKEV